MRFLNVAPRSQNPIVGIPVGGNRKRYFHKIGCLETRGTASGADRNRGSTGPDWVRDYAKQQQKQKLLQKRADMEARLAKIRDKERKEKERTESGIAQKAKKRVLYAS